MTEHEPTSAFQADPIVDQNTPNASAPTATVGPRVPPDAVPLPRPFGRYTLQRLLGKGGMGRVYLAHDPQLDRLVALKMPNPVESDAGWRERFLTEARAAATLTHPNVCPVYDVGEVDAQPYLTMAFIEGETLAAKLAREGPFSVRKAVELVETVARAMHEAHRRGIVHRDLKPANLMLDSAGRPMVMDFGLAIRSTSADDLRLTLTGVALGTPAYMPPEQAGGDNDSIGAPADVYALGVILFELVTGRTPFRAKTFGKLLAQIERDPPPPPSSFNPKVDPALEAIILTALAKAPTDRFASAAEFADALDRHLQGDREGLVSLYTKPYVIPKSTAEYPSEATSLIAQPARSRRRGWLLAGVALFLFGALIAVGAGIYVETDYGQIVVQLSDPKARVDVRVNGQEVTLAAEGGKPVRVRAGKNQKLEVSGADFETVAESFDLKRGDVHLARVTLKPKVILAQQKLDPNPVDPFKKKPGDLPKKDPVDPPKKEVVVKPPEPEPKPKTTPFPDKATLIEVAGWQMLVDASKEEMQKWLDRRKKDKHTVTWLDAYPIDDRPVFAAVAATDNRSPGWETFLDTPLDAISEKVKLRAVRIVSFCGYGSDGANRTAFLFRPEQKRWFLGGDLTLAEISKELPAAIRDGMAPRGIRPYPIKSTAIRYVYHVESAPGKTPPYHIDIGAGELAAILKNNQADGYRPVSLAATVRDGEQRFSVVMEPNVEKWDWLTDTQLPSSELKTKAQALAAKGFRPSCLTGYAFDGAMRYCVVWVKEASPTVPYPKGPTVVKIAGWEILADATKEEMQKWLDARAQAKHSVTFIDCYQVGDKPVFCGVAALDDRQPKWGARLDMPATEFNPDGEVGKLVDLKKETIVSLSGYPERDKIRCAMLWRAPRTLGWTTPDDDPDTAVTTLEKERKSRNFPEFLRPYPIGGENPVLAFVTRKELAAQPRDLWKLDASELEAFISAARKDDFVLKSLCAYPRLGRLEFAAVAWPNRAKQLWKTDTHLTVAELQARATEIAAQGYRPDSVTAYAWDGAVRYCAVWVKDAVRTVSYPTGPTLVQLPGWQILVDADKEQMQNWLDDRKKDKHSVTWLDAHPVGNKPVFAAIAALDNRQSKWLAFLDVKASEFGTGAILKRFDVKKNVMRSAGGYVQEGDVTLAMLFIGEPRLWDFIPDCAENILDAWEQREKKTGYSYQFARPFPFSPSATLWTIYSERKAAAHRLDLAPKALAEELEKMRAANRRPLAVAGSAGPDGVRFSMTSAVNADKLDWLVDADVPAAKLKVSADQRAKAGYRPEGISAYAWDGAVRYCVLWVKDTAKEK